MAENRNVGSSTFSSNSCIESEIGNMWEDCKSEMRQFFCHANGYLADPKEARGIREGFGHLLSQVH